MALTELRRALDDGLARAGLNKSQLAARTGLGRTTVSQAFQADGGVPSAATVAALADALRLPSGKLLDLRRQAAGDTGTAEDVSGPGKPIGEWEPHALEVHPAGPDVQGRRVLSGYVRREHDQVLAAAVEDVAAGHSRIVVLVGSSSTGKTRACWEAVQPLAEHGWLLWHPFDPTRADAAIDALHHVRPRTVVWLNEAQHYLGDAADGERIAAAVHHLLTSPERGPVLVLGTLWPEYATRYMTLPTAGRIDPHSRVRELLSGRLVSVPEVFDSAALAGAAGFAAGGDRLLADALTRAQADGRVAQDLAGAPELLHRHQHATPGAKAILEAAMDARRLGVGLHLPQGFLTDAATDYPSDTDYDLLPDDWAEQAYAELAGLVHGKQAPLRRTTPRPARRPPTPATRPPAPASSGPVFRLADYLEQHGRTTRRHLCPPASFWHAALSHLTNHDELEGLAREAEVRYRLQWARHLLQRAADHGNTRALAELADIREEAGDREGAEALYRQAADRGNTNALADLARMREETGHPEGAEALYRQAADNDNPIALMRLAEIRERAGDRGSAEALYQQAADHGNPHALTFLAEIREKAGDREGAERLARQATDQGHPHTPTRLAEIRERAGDRESAEALYQQAAKLGSPIALMRLIRMREKAGDREGAERLARQAADLGRPRALTLLAEMRAEAGDLDDAERLARQAADLGDTDALAFLAVTRDKHGDREGAERLARQAADQGHGSALTELAVLREEAGDREGAEALYRQAADHGSIFDPVQPGMGSSIEELWPHGLDPDGTPTPPWP
ncbi:helix-turn-helix domain-containing protein [Streptomyces sp. NPDC059382]|uniref:helix-turn-helix domain-containing protein n=1 Tax=Streptomyces sp. NPDC059382 TaxID=3346816 RepID=UPI0036BEDD28